MKTFKRSVGFFLLAVMLCYCVVFPPFARADYTTNSNFWHWLDQNPIGDNLTGHILGYIASTDVCSESSDSKHHASSVTGVSADGYYICVCENCGNEFTSSNLASTAYDEYVEELPAQEINSDGAYVWQSSYYDFYRSENGSFVFPSYYSYAGAGMSIGVSNTPYSSDSLAIFLLSDDIVCYNAVRLYSSLYVGLIYSAFKAPVSGRYSLLASVAVSGDVSAVYSPANLGFRNSGDYVSWSYSYDTGLTSYPHDVYFHFPVFAVTPLSGAVDVSSTNPSDTYNIGTRAASLSGNFGTIDGNGNVQQVQATSIVDESTSTIYNPVTDTTSVITDWSYDYSDRSYTLTLDNGQTSTVTYGDQYITIQEGSQSYNVYYLVNSGSGTGSAGSGGSGSGETPTVPHTHSYTSAVTTPASCTLSGVRTYTCSCGASYTETIPATGHNWTVKDSVQTEYSSSGALIQEGFTIYRCSACGEEYKSSGRDGPPLSSADESILDKLGHLLGGVATVPLRIIFAAIGKILDALIALVEIIGDKLVFIVQIVLGWFDYIPSLFGGFLDFLGVCFRFLPEDVITLFTFGIASVVFIGIIKAVRR